MSEADFLDNIIRVAEHWMGWRALHLRPARKASGWRTAVQGRLGEGWPDLILVRGPRIIAAEVKSTKGKVTPEQSDVLAVLAAAGIETHVWRPDDWDDVVRLLRSPTGS